MGIRLIGFPQIIKCALEIGTNPYYTHLTHAYTYLNIFIIALILLLRKNRDSTVRNKHIVIT